MAAISDTWMDGALDVIDSTPLDVPLTDLLRDVLENLSRADRRDPDRLPDAGRRRARTGGGHRRSRRGCTASGSRPSSRPGPACRMATSGWPLLAEFCLAAGRACTQRWVPTVRPGGTGGAGPGPRPGLLADQFRPCSLRRRGRTQRRPERIALQTSRSNIGDLKMATLLYRLGAFAVRRRWAVLLVWLRAARRHRRCRGRLQGRDDGFVLDPRDAGPAGARPAQRQDSGGGWRHRPDRLCRSRRAARWPSRTTSRPSPTC